MNTALMISVVNGNEALAALEGGADIIDIKNPAEGALGAPTSAIVKEISSIIKGKIPFSIALGEFPEKRGAASLAALGSVYFKPDYVKIAFIPNQSAEEILGTLQAIRESLCLAGETPVSLVAVTYAESLNLASWSLDEFALISKEGGADGCLVDTWEKKNKSLLDYLSLEDAEKWIKCCHQLELFCGLAGSLKYPDVKKLKELEPDIIGVRSAVCGGDRLGGKVSTQAVRALKRRLAVDTFRNNIHPSSAAGL